MKAECKLIMDWHCPHCGSGEVRVGQPNEIKPVLAIDCAKCGKEYMCAIGLTLKPIAERPRSVIVLASSLPSRTPA